MPSDKREAKATGLTISLFHIASAGHMSFGILQYIQCILHGLTSVFLCVPFIFADSERYQFSSSTWYRWFPFITEDVFFIVATSITEFQTGLDLQCCVTQ